MPLRTCAIRWISYVRNSNMMKSGSMHCFLCIRKYYFIAQDIHERADSAHIDYQKLAKIL
ncbi:hypothetical protein D9B85_13865 [Corynebacterium diphtheriae]|nr:hypothetical protein D9B85_13865 [Corynebacterium diphtheriae]